MDAIGHVVGLLGAVSAEQAGATRVLQLGGDIFADDVLLTGSGAHVEIRFQDQSVLSQGENARLSIDSFVYDVNDSQASNMVLKMAEGTFRMVTGEIAAKNPEGVSMVSPLATIGIRGTGADMRVGSEGIQVGIFQYDGKDLTVTTPMGTVIINNANLILDVLADGSFGELRSYTDFEKAFYDAVAPILSVPVIREDGGQDEGDQGQGEDQDAEGEGDEVTVEVQPVDGANTADILAYLAGALEGFAADDTLEGGAGEDTLGQDLGELSSDLSEFMSQLYALYSTMQQTGDEDEEDTLPATAGTTVEDTIPASGGQDDGGSGGDDGGGTTTTGCDCPAVDQLDGTSGYTILGETTGVGFAVEFAAAGDVNGDGVDDFLVSAPSADPNDVTNAGQLYLLFGGSHLAALDAADGSADGNINVSRIDGTHGYVIQGWRTNGKLGADNRCKNISTAGDFNGDGSDDLVLGAPGYPNNTAPMGEGYVLFGGTNLAALDAMDGSTDGVVDIRYLDSSEGGNGANGFVLNGFTSYDQGGTASGSTDLNGDGHADAILTGFMAGSPTDSGEVYVIFGGDGWTGGASLNQNSVNGTNGVYFTNSNYREFMGTSVSGVKDMNADGYGEILIGANEAHGSNTYHEGKVYLVYGGENGVKGESSALTSGFNVGNLNGTNGYVLEGDGQYDVTGACTTADVNGDGVADLIIGAPQTWSGQLGPGRVYVVYGDKLATLDAADGTADGSIQLAKLLENNGGDGSCGYVIEGNAGSTDRIGMTVQSAGDVNNDGYEDFMISAPYVVHNKCGEAYLVFGGANGVKGWTSAQTTLDPDQLGGESGLILPGKVGSGTTGYSVGGVGDVDDDGYDDFGVTAHNVSPAGELYLILGSGFTGQADSTILSVNGSGTITLAVRGQDDTDKAEITLANGGNVNMQSGSANDVDLANVEIVDAGLYKGHLHLSGTLGADTVTGGSGGLYADGLAGDDSIMGGSAADELYGGAGNDQLFGYAGNDTLCGGEGTDLLNGGSGADVFRYMTAAEMSQDFLNDCSWVQDKLQFDSSGFGNLAVGGLEAARFFSVSSYNVGDVSKDGGIFILDNASSRLYYDADGDDGAAATDFISLNSISGFDHEDIEIVSLA